MVLKIHERSRALIFDIDGTLIDTMPTHFQAWQQVAKIFGFEFSEEMLDRYAGIPSGDIVLAINRQQKLELNVNEVVKAKNDAYLKMIAKIKRIDPVIQLVKENHGKLPMALGTGEYREVAMINIQTVGLTEYFEIIVTADDVREFKPNPETFLKCAEKMKVPPEFCQVFEDGEPGLEAAKRAGMIVTDVRPFIKGNITAKNFYKLGERVAQK